MNLTITKKKVALFEPIFVHIRTFLGQVRREIGVSFAFLSFFMPSLKAWLLRKKQSRKHDWNEKQRILSLQIHEANNQTTKKLPFARKAARFNENESIFLATEKFVWDVLWYGWKWNEVIMAAEAAFELCDFLEMKLIG